MPVYCICLQHSCGMVVVLLDMSSSVSAAVLPGPHGQ